MIFVTVGTHEQPFNRLIKCIDDLKKNQIIKEEVVIQTGFSTYVPTCCVWSKTFSYQEMWNHINTARIVITHGGPSSFIMPLQIGKIPIVVPRQKKFNEHVNDHQLDFVRQVAERNKNIIVVEDIDKLQEVIKQYDYLKTRTTNIISSNNQKFNDDFKNIVDKMFMNNI